MSPGREKTDIELGIESRWRERLIEGASTRAFQEAYDELHAEFMAQQQGEGEIYDRVNPRADADDRLRAVIVASIAPADKVLEIGTGDGVTAARIAEQGAHVTSVDVSQLALERAREHWGGRADLDLTFAYGDARSLNAADGTLDAVVSENMVEHISLDDMRAHLAEVYRVLAPGGRYLLYTPSRVWSGRVSVGFHLHVYSLRELVQLLREYGFKVSWMEPRLLARTGRLWRLSGFWLRLACWYESLLVALRVQSWPVPIKARIIPGIMVAAEKPAVTG